MSKGSPVQRRHSSNEAATVIKPIAQVACAALQRAIEAGGGQVDGVIFHTGRGSAHTYQAFQQLCGRWGVVQSMGCVGSALANAAAELFHSVLKVEYIHRHIFATRAEARLKAAT